jgi:HNH endonuclease
MVEKTCEICKCKFLITKYKSDRGKGRFCSLKCYEVWQQAPLKERFARYVGEPDKNGCIPWLGGTTKKNREGYGTINLGNNSRKSDKAHRVAWELVNGPIPEKLQVLHTCDNPICVNAEHLFLGTHDDNMKDKASKGRGASMPGDENPSVKLTKEDIIEIRNMHKSKKMSYTELSKKYNISDVQIWRIVSYRSWTDM